MTTRTFGKIGRSRDEDGVYVSKGSKYWLVQAEPQVMIKFKRLFEKVSKSSFGAFIVRDNRETCRDLEWMLERFPLEISEADKRYMRAQANQHRRLGEDVAEILSADYKPKEFPLALPPRDYQRVAADVLLRRDGMLLADQLGVGKTVSAICAIVDKDSLPALVVVPKHLQIQWQREIRRFAPHLSTHIIRTGRVYDLTKYRKRTLPFPDVIICTYSKLVGWAEELAGTMKLVVFEEAQELRHGTETAKGQAAEFVAKKADRRLGLSATPIHNYGGEIWNVMNIITPGELGDRVEFMREWCRTEVGYGGKEKGFVKDESALGAYLREQGLMLRRSRADVGRELPPLTKVMHHVDVDMKPLDDIRGAAAELARIILAQGGKGLDKMRAAEELDWKLRQATGIAKAPYVADLVRMTVESGEPVLLSGWHRDVYSIWMERLNDLHPVMFTGSESLKAKEEARAKFMAGQSGVMIISLRSGAGLDGLQHRCRTIIHGELDWSPAVHDQLDGRANRDGQTQAVTAIYAISDTGSDPTIVDALGLKRQQLEGILNPGGENVIAQADPQRLKKLAEAFLEQNGKRGTGGEPEAQAEEEEAA